MYAWRGVQAETKLFAAPKNNRQLFHGWLAGNAIDYPTG